MPDVLFRILGDQVEASVRANQVLGQRRILLLPCLDLPGLCQSFPDHAVQLDPLLYL